MLRLFRTALFAGTVLASVLVVTVPSAADPIFGGLALLAFNAGLGVGVTNAILGVGVLGSLASTVGTLALGLGVTYIQGLLNRPQQQKPSDGQVETRQAIPPRVWHYGRVKIGGALAFYESRDATLYKAVMVSSREVDAIEQVYLNDAVMAVDGSGYVVTEPYENGSNPLVRIATHVGTEDQGGDLILNGAFPTEWTGDHRLRGTAYIVISCATGPTDEFQAHYPSGEPQVSALLRGCKIYDPRTETTVWSDNPALAILDYLTHPDGYARPLAKIDIPSFIAMANLCDEAVPLAAGGTEKRYRIATTINLTEARKDVLARLLEACDARLYPLQNGKTAIRGGKWEAPTVTIDADLGHIIETNFAPPDAMSRFNELSIQYLDPALDYVENEGTPWQDVADITATGELVTVPADYVQVPSHSQARRLAKIRMARENSDWVGEIVTNLNGLNVIDQRVITLNWPELDINGPYWVEGAPELLPDWTGVRISLRSANAAAYDWTTAEEGTSTSIPPDTAPVLSLDPPILTLSEIDGPAIRADWTPSDALSRQYEVEYRPDAGGTYTAMAVAPSRDSAESGIISTGLYQVRIRTIAGVAAVGAWSADNGIMIEGPFNPSLLFTGGAAGVWLDPSDLSTLFQDSAGTVPVTLDGHPVGRINDKSGNGNHFTQTTSAARPIYKVSGGVHWLEFDGVDAELASAAITHPSPASVFVGLTTSDTIFVPLYNGAGTELLGTAETGSASPPHTSGAPSYHLDNGAALTATRAALSVAFPTGAPSIMEVRGPTLSVLSPMRFGGYPSAPYQYSGRLSSLVICPTPTSTRRAELYTYLAAVQGRTL